MHNTFSLCLYMVYPTINVIRIGESYRGEACNYKTSYKGMITLQI